MSDKRAMINNGKRIIFLGSSVTYGSAAGGISFADIICEKYGYEMIKEAVSGTTLVDEDDESYVKRIMGIKADSADLFVCQLSTNDASHDSQLGNIAEGNSRDSFDLSTIAGAIEYIIAYARKKWKCPIAFYTGIKYDSEKYANMVLLLKRIARKWDIEIINLWDDPELNAVSSEDYKRFMADPIHPTLEGYREWWSPFIEERINKILELQADLTGIWSMNQEYERTAFSGIRPVFQIMDNYMTSGVIEGNDRIENGDIVRVKLITPKYYANSVWVGKEIDAFDGSKRIGTVTVQEILNPILDADGDKWVLIDGRDIETTDDFFNMMRAKLTDGTDDLLGSNFNGFNDLLWGGFGFHDYEEPLNIVWIFSEMSREKLGADFETIVEIIDQHESGKIRLELYKEHVLE